MKKTLDELKQEVSLLWYVQEWTQYSVSKQGHVYDVSPCPVCSHENHLKIYDNTNSFNSFNGCCKGGSIIDWFIQIEGLTMEDAIEKLKELGGESNLSRGTSLLTADNKRSNAPERLSKGSNSLNGSQGMAVPQEPKKKTDDINARVRAWHNSTMENEQLKGEMYEYLSKRGIGLQQILDNHMSIIQEGKWQWLILPVKNAQGEYIHYVKRSFNRKENQPKYTNVKRLSMENCIYNGQYLETTHKEPIFLTESMIDAMNLETLGFKAIALNSTSNFNSFMDRFKKSTAQHSFLIGAMDNDTEGRKKTEQLKGLGYKALNIPSIVSNEKGEDVTDVNEWYMYDLKRVEGSQEDEINGPDILPMKDAINAQIKELELINARPDNIEHYLLHSFEQDIEKLSKCKDIKTGFEQLDYHLGGLSPSLYVIGGMSSLGKTTFIHQVFDQLAELGQDVIFFSLEQSKTEMVSKSLARELYKANKDNEHECLTSFKIRKGFKSAALNNSIKTYSKYASRVNIVQCGFNWTIKDMREYVERYISLNGVSPIVAVDYLQVMPPLDYRLTDRQKIDTNVQGLKALSQELEIPVFVISSFNRTSYTAPVSFESFKESGGIEYTADVVLGMELSILQDDDFMKLKDDEKRLKAHEAKAQEVRDIRIKALKNRNGKLFDIRFNYHSQYDFFECTDIDTEYAIMYEKHLKGSEGSQERSNGERVINTPTKEKSSEKGRIGQNRRSRKGSNKENDKEVEKVLYLQETINKYGIENCRKVYELFKAGDIDMTQIYPTLDSLLEKPEYIDIKSEDKQTFFKLEPSFLTAPEKAHTGSQSVQDKEEISDKPKYKKPTEKQMDEVRKVVMHPLNVVNYGDEILHDVLKQYREGEITKDDIFPKLERLLAEGKAEPMAEGKERDEKIEFIKEHFNYSHTF